MNALHSIAIVGGGPAGALAGALLAAAGVEVHIFDEKLAWEKPCGGGLTFKALQQYPFLAEAGAQSKSDASKSGASNFIEHCELIAPSGKRVRFRMQHPVAIFSRLALNGLLLERAQFAGASVRRERVTKIEGGAGDWRLCTPGGNYRASYVILAAGARNPFRGQFTAPFPPEDLMATAGYYIPVRSSLMQIQFLKSITGYIWIFPRLDHASAGIAGKMGEVTTRALRRELEQWLEENGFSLEGATFYSHILPSLRARSMEKIEVAGNGWAMVGDSAGLVDPITGEGLYYALRSAELYAESLLAARPEEYKLRLEEEVLSELRLAARVSDRFYHGRVFGESIPEQMIALTSQSDTFRDLMSDLFAGIQGYRDLKARLYRILPAVMAEDVASTLLRPLRAGGLHANSTAE
ncbi:MAG: NAD(P)/FAD-dependent oxidoreductase [Terriglobales bacterium]